MSDRAAEVAGVMSDFVIRRNILRFEKLLTLETNAGRRDMIAALIGEEEAKLTDLLKIQIRQACRLRDV